jgi:hypothetical protein
MPPARPVCAGELAKRGNSPAQQDGTRQRNSAPCPVLIRPSGFLIHSRTSLSDLIATEFNHPITVSSATTAGSFLANRTKPLTYCVVAIVARHAAARCCVASLRRDVAPLFLTRKWVFQPQIGSGDGIQFADVEIRIRPRRFMWMLASENRNRELRMMEA